jgi:ketosteroid isomerase-like protein
VLELFAAERARDLARCRALVHDDVVYQDHRRTGPGPIKGAGAYVAWLGSLWESAEDGTRETVYLLAAEPHGSLGMARIYGTLPDGGEFESMFVRLFAYRDGRLVLMEIFEPDDLEVARRRFEALRPVS